MTLSPYSPNERVEPRHALPRILPFCCLRNLTFFGINIAKIIGTDRTGDVLGRLVLQKSELQLERSSTRNHGLTALLLVNVAAVDPGLDADDSVGGVRLGETVVDVGAQRVQRQTALEIPLGTGDLVAVQAAGNANLDSLAAETQRRIDALAHGAAEANALLKLESDVLGDQLGVELGLVDLENVDKHIAAGALAELGLELLNLRTLAADHDAGTRGADDEPQLVARTLDLDRADACGLQLVLELSLEFDVLDQQLGVVTNAEPARAPGLVDTEPKTIRVDFLSHTLPLKSLLLRVSY